MKSTLLLVLLIFLGLGCGSSITDPGGEDDGQGALSLKVLSPLPFNPAISHAAVAAYRVTITGEGIEPPIVVDVAFDATSATISDIPAGPNRLIQVESLNSNGIVFRQGESRVEIPAGAVAAATITLESVPIVTNMANGNWVASKRLRFHILSEADGPIQVERLESQNGQPLLDIVSNHSEVYPDISTGLATVVPLGVPLGLQRFHIHNTLSGRYSILELNIFESATMSAPFSAAGHSDEAGSQSRLQPLGGPL